MCLYFKTIHTHTHTHTPILLVLFLWRTLNKTLFSSQLLCMTLQLLFHMLMLFRDTSTSAFDVDNCQTSCLYSLRTLHVFSVTCS